MFEFHNYNTGHCYLGYEEVPGAGEKEGYTKRRLMYSDNYMDNYAQIGDFITTKRMEQNKSQLDLAKAVGLQRTSITNIEIGRQRVPIDRLKAIFYVLGYRLKIVANKQ